MELPRALWPECEFPVDTGVSFLGPKALLLWLTPEHTSLRSQGGCSWGSPGTKVGTPEKSIP